MDAARMHETACAYALSPTQAHLDAALAEALPLCALIARRFSGRGIEYEDLLQVASFACVEALRKFDAARGLKFSTYVTPTITGTLRNYLRDKAELLHTPRGIKERSAQLAAARESFLQKTHREPTPRELAEMLRWDVGQVLLSLSAREANAVSSLDQTDEEGLTLGERIPFLEQGFEQFENREALMQALAILTDEEKTLLSLRFREQLSQRETAARLGMSQMQISRKEKRILALLRHEMEGEG